MQETAARLDKVQAAWTRAQDKAKTLSQHSKKIASQLHDKGVALASAQAAQELALARVRALEAEMERERSRAEQGKARKRERAASARLVL